MNQENSVAPSSLALGELLKSRCAHALGTAGLTILLGVAPFGAARAQTAPVGVPDKSFRKASHPPRTAPSMWAASTLAAL